MNPANPMKNLKHYLLLCFVVVITVSLPVISYQLGDIQLIENLPGSINRQLIYQPLTLGISLILLVMLKLSRKEVFQMYFRKGHSSARILPEPYVGIKPKPGETWAKAGLEWSIVISLVTAVVIWFHVFSGAHFSMDTMLKVLPFVFILALINSFVEEAITRIGVIVALKGFLNDRMIAITSGALFGTVHYFGSPGGIIGVLVAGFLGWLLAKSILETKGIFWALLIHFLQDVIIMTAMFSA